MMQTGRSGMIAAKAGISTTGHNIANANTEGYSRQRVHQQTNDPVTSPDHRSFVGRGVNVSRIDRVNDGYLEKQIRRGSMDLAELEEKDLGLTQIEDIFNELHGDGLNRIISKFFNQFRSLSNDPDNESLRQAVREASQSVINDFKRLRTDVIDVQNHLDNRIEGYVQDVNRLAKEIRDLNVRIADYESRAEPANDLMDHRDIKIKELSDLIETRVRYDKKNMVSVDLKGGGPLVSTVLNYELSVKRTGSDDEGKSTGTYDIFSNVSSPGKLTHSLQGGKLGGTLNVRDRSLNTVLSRLDEMAFNIAKTVNEIHRQGVTRNGVKGVNFFKEPVQVHRASEYLKLSDEVMSNVNFIATAATKDAPGDNRIAIAISGLQDMKLMNDGKSSFDEWYNGIVADVGMAKSHNTEGINQQKNIVGQLNKMREQISGVSIDEETMDLMKYQHAFDASARVISVADQMLETVLNIKKL